MRPQVHKSKRFVTPEVTAVFPHLNEPDQFGNYSVDVDVLNNPELERQIATQVAETIEAGQKRFNTNKQPTNSFVRDGEYKGDPWRRISFKMKGTRTVKGVDHAQKPRVVDAHKNTMTDEVWGGSKVKVAYFIQYTVTPSGCFASVKLDAVQVLQHVGPGGEVAIDDLFDEEEGFVASPTVDDATEQEAGPPYHAERGEVAAPQKAAAEF